MYIPTASCIGLCMYISFFIVSLYISLLYIMLNQRDEKTTGNLESHHVLGTGSEPSQITLVSKSDFKPSKIATRSRLESTSFSAS